MPAFSKSSGLKSVFEKAKLRFGDGFVWTIVPAVKISFVFKFLGRCVDAAYNTHSLQYILQLICPFQNERNLNSIFFFEITHELSICAAKKHKMSWYFEEKPILYTFFLYTMVVVQKHVIIH